MPYEQKGEKVREHIKGAPQDVNDTYNAIMRDKFKGDDSEDNQSSAAAIAWSQHNKKKSSPWIPLEHENAAGQMERQPGAPCQCGVCQGQGPPLMPGHPDRHDMGAGDRADMALIPPRDDQSVDMSYQASADDAEPDKKCPHCEALLEPNVGYDACPHCGHEMKTSARSPDGYGDTPYRTTQWQCPQCGNWDYEYAGARGGSAWHDCKQCGWREQSPTDVNRRQAPEGWDEQDQGVYDYDDWVPMDRVSKWQVVALGEAQQPGGVGATQTTGLVDGTGIADSEHPDDFTDVGQNSTEENMALQTWVNFAVDMLNRGRNPEEITAQLAHDGCPDPKGVLEKAMAQPEKAPIPNEGAQDPFDIPHNQDDTGEMQSTSQQPPVVTGKTAPTCPECEGAKMRYDDHVWICPKCDYETSEPYDDEDDGDEKTSAVVWSEWEKPWDTKDSDDEKDEDDDDDVKDDKKKKTADADSQVFDFGGEEKTKGDLFDTDAEKTEGGTVFDVDQAEGNEPGELFNIQAPGSETDSPLGDAPTLEKPGTLSKIRIAGTTMTGVEVDRWEDMWGQTLVKVALDDGGTMNVAPEAIQNYDEDQKHPVTEIQAFVDSLPKVEPTRPSIMARVANLEKVRRSVRANINTVGFGDQVKLQQLDSDAQDEIIYLKDNFGIVSNANDYAWLQEQPRYSYDGYGVGAGNPAQAGELFRQLRLSGVPTEEAMQQVAVELFNGNVAEAQAAISQGVQLTGKLANEEAALWLSEQPGELRIDAEGLAYAAAQYAQAHNGNVLEFVAAVQKFAHGEDLTGQVDDYGDPIECLDGPDGCQGKLQYRMSLSPSGRPFPRCDAHWNQRLNTQDEINRKYPAMQPSDFDPGYAGERWDDDY